MRNRMRENPDGWSHVDLQAFCDRNLAYAKWNIYCKGNPRGRYPEMGFTLLGEGPVHNIVRDLHFESTPYWPRATLSFKDSKLLEMLVSSFRGDEARLISRVEFVTDPITWSVIRNLIFTGYTTFPNPIKVKFPDWMRNKELMAMDPLWLPNLERFHIHLVFMENYVDACRGLPADQQLRVGTVLYQITERTRTQVQELNPHIDVLVAHSGQLIRQTTGPSGQTAGPSLQNADLSPQSPGHFRRTPGASPR
ncbi:hypothetical protein EK21DRAFT_115752 [Setomelanomma holmii]|uniref:Uncharacterized protein n=1 Tax=Setomelanomma holmii TaxID=210430 RepID=A0A9P4H3M6_9PLEO|nr:hypothetical protein EK21DRAFT_115752 [Setomelanomma holmii]